MSADGASNNHPTSLCRPKQRHWGESGFTYCGGIPSKMQGIGKREARRAENFSIRHLLALSPGYQLSSVSIFPVLDVRAVADAPAA